ncbi:hypothetical protein MLD63_15510 [Paracoccus sp. TK19116]|uniref:Lipoprotein n=2 Tax=Paracoccus albicereus TaxID=2922394 RepID=A0ABT1MU26_9RHOB|nr:hypothetical protein [Paracoccus albicereus]
MKITYLVAAATLGLAGCAVAPSDGKGTPPAGIAALAGDYNLARTECGQPNSLTSLSVTGGNFRFYESSCTVSSYDQTTGDAVLACTGEGSNFTRNVRLESAPGELHMTDDGVTLTYLSCAAPDAQRTIDAAGAAARSAAITASVM